MANTTVNKVVLGDETLIDLTPVTVIADKLVSGYTALDASGALITGAITQRSSTDLTASGATVSVPAGYYSAQASKSVASGSAGTPTATKVVDATDASALITPSVTNTAGYISGGTKTGTPFYVTAGELVSGNTLTADDSGNWDVTELETLVIPAGTAGMPTATKGTVSNHAVSVTPSVTNSAGYISGGTKTGTAVTVSASELVSGTLTADDSGDWDVTNAETFNVPAGTAGTPTATKGTVNNNAVSVTPSVTNTTGYITGGTKTGTAVTVTAAELVNGTLYINSSGTKDVTNYASASIAAGGATASATKGTVSNHSITVTPSVTRTAGYVTAGSANGTAVTVSASELVSGIYAVDASGTHDVTNYASVSVAAGNVTASASKSVRNNVATVTPSETRTAGWVAAGSTNGTVVTVSASELVSGSETKTANGTYDVTNLASLVVAVPYSTIYSGTLSPSSSQGSNGDVYLKTVS